MDIDWNEIEQKRISDWSDNCDGMRCLDASYTSAYRYVDRGLDDLCPCRIHESRDYSYC